jgi:glycosyltransferase involved in cell wall biosynthesis
MKIAIVLWELNIKGGTQRQALELAYNLQTIGHQVDVFTYYYNQKECYSELCQKLKINYISLEKERPSTLKQKIINNFYRDERMVNLKNLIKNTKIDYDVINIHDYQVYKITNILNHKNVIWMMNDIPGQFLINKIDKLKSLLYILNAQLLKRFTKKIKKIIVLDNRVKGIFHKKYKLDAIVVRSGLDLNMYSDYPNYNKVLAKNDIKIFASSIFFPYRRFEDIVDAVEIIKNTSNIKLSLTINGNPNRNVEYFNFIRQRIKDKKLSEIISITTGLNEKELKNKYLEANIFIFPNHQQTWGLSVFEAMLAGCVCLVSKTSGAHEVLTDNQNALLINPKAPEEIAQKIIRLANNPEIIENISANAKKFVYDNLSWKRYAENMLKVFKGEYED